MCGISIGKWGALFPGLGCLQQEYWSVLSHPPPGDLPDPGIEPSPLTSPALAGRFFTTSATWEVPSLGCGSWQTYEIWREEKAAFRAQISGKARVSEGALAPAGVFPHPQT